MQSPTYTIDWLAYTTPYGPTLNSGNGTTWMIQRAQVAIGAHLDLIPTKPRHGYTLAWTTAQQPGPIVYQLPADGGRHMHVVWTGSALQHYNGLMDPLDHAVGSDYSVTRLDLAYDVFAGDPDDVYNAHQAGDVKTRLQKLTRIQSDTGTTVYAGSRVSQRFIRVYDKAGQMAVPGPWTRIELELKAEAARNIARFLHQEGPENIPGVIKTVLTCPTLPWWEAAFAAVDAVWGDPQPEKVPDTETWLREQVLKAIMKLHRGDPKRFERVWQYMYSRVGEGTGFFPDPFDGHADFD